MVGSIIAAATTSKQASKQRKKETNKQTNKQAQTNKKKHIYHGAILKPDRHNPD
jgi:hypothetical protein